MSPKKITDSEKLEIVNLYRQSGETTSSIASRYGVSNSTINRLLKSSIPEDEYEAIVQQKRGQKSVAEENDEEVTAPSPEQPPAAPTAASTEEIHYGTTAGSSLRRKRQSANPTAPVPSETESVEETSAVSSPSVTPVAAKSEDLTEAHTRRVRRRSSALAGAVEDTPRSRLESIDTSTPTEQSISPDVAPFADGGETPLPTKYYPSTPAPITSFTSMSALEEEEEEEDEEEEDVSALAAMFGEEIDDGDIDDEEDDDDWEDESTDDRTSGNGDGFGQRDRSQIQVLPLSEAILPRTCYVVIDKFAELIARPLKDFADLGQIPGEEIQQRTLPIFDNHRIAKRFSNHRTQRVIKVPDTRIFHKTTHHLRSKGITRLLVDGRVYSLN
jgi:transposase-like protein